MATNRDMLEALLVSSERTNALLEALVVNLSPAQPAKVTAPAKVAAPKPAKEVPAFIVKRAQRKEARHEAAAWMRSKGLTPNGPAWDAVMAGERNVARLRKIAKAA